MPEVFKLPEAEVDLEAIWFYIALNSPTNADNFIDLIDQRCQLLAENPMMGRRRPELANDLRSFPLEGYIIFYRPMQNGIEILRVISGARDIESLF